MLKSIVNWFCLFLFGVLCLHAQSPRIDSMRNVLNTTKNDTEKVNTFYRIAREYFFISRRDSTAVLAARALALSEKTGFKKGIADSYHILAVLKRDENDYKEALRLNEKALKIREDLKDKKGISMSLGNIGIVYRRLSDDALALEYYRRAHPLYIELGNKDDIAINLHNIAEVYHSQGNYPRALEYSFSALKMFEEIGNRLLVANALGNIGNIYEDQRDLTKALDYYFKAVKIAEQAADVNLMATWYSNIGSVFQKKRDYKKTEEYFNRAREIFEKEDNLHGLAVVLGNFGLMYNMQNNYDKALEYLFRALAIAEKLGEKKRIALQLGNIATTYIDMKKYSEGESYLKRSLDLFTEINDLHYRKEFEKAYSHLDSIKGNFKAALEHYKNYIAIKDSLASEENTKKQTRIEMQYEFDKKEAETRAAQVKKDAVAGEEKRRQEIVLLCVVAGLTLVLLFSVFIFRAFRQKQKVNLKISRQKEIIEEKQKEILDSIYYARRIQRSLLPSDKYINRVLTNTGKRKAD